MPFGATSEVRNYQWQSEHHLSDIAFENGLPLIGKTDPDLLSMAL
jgi:hypothetical protein